MGASAAVRMGDFKLVERFSNMEVELFNLKDDLSEQKNLSNEYPEVVEKLRKMLHDWRKETNAMMPKKRRSEWVQSITLLV